MLFDFKYQLALSGIHKNTAGSQLATKWRPGLVGPAQLVCVFITKSD